MQLPFVRACVAQVQVATLTLNNAKLQCYFHPYKHNIVLKTVDGITKKLRMKMKTLV